MKLFVYGFWSGFIDKTNPVNISFFIELFKLVFNQEIELSNFDESDILLETIFDSNTYLFKKKWKYSFLFSGESRLNNIYSNYSCVLYGERNHNNIINVPLFIPTIYCSNLMVQLMNPLLKTNINIPLKNICAVISNPSGIERNDFLNELERTIPVDYGGDYKNNVEKFKDTYNSNKFIERVAEYKFMISMENSKGDTYITEKILHGLLAGTIPIYWGSNNIIQYFNPERILILPNKIHTTELINTIKEILSDDNKYKNIINKPIFNNNKLNRYLTEIANDIKHLLFKREVSPITKIFLISNPIFEPVRYERLTNLFKSNDYLKNFDVEFICPTYKQTITNNIMNTHVKSNLVKRLRHNGMKKSEISLFLNYKQVLKTIVDNYLDGIFMIFESDVFIDDTSITELDEFLQFVANHKQNWDLIHIGKGGDEQFFGKPFCDEILPYRDKINHLPVTFIEDLTTSNDRFRLVRKFHTRCTDSFIWNFKGVEKFYNCLNHNIIYDAPFDYYLTNFLENRLDFKCYWSFKTFFIQGSNYNGLDISTIQQDVV
jgi:hypothetical protein